jgi:Protein of unknown function (DUF2541)
MTMFRTLAMACVASAALVVSVGVATAQELRPIGEVQFEPEPYSLERDSFQIKEGDRRIRALRIQADEGSADVRSFTVTYADGQTEKVRVRQVLKEGEKTALFQLDEPRPVRSIEIAYIPKGPVTLIMLADRKQAPPPVQWEELACKSVGFLIDRDVVSLNTQERYKSLRLRSVGYDIEMIEMAVRFGNGQRDVYNIRTVIPSNGRTGPIDMRGEARRIREIELVYRARAIGTSKTRLCVDGLKFNPDDEDN